MKLRSVSIRNFRAIKAHSFNLNSSINVLVGPNASGKTTVLEAIRLNKAMLAPRTQNEAHQVLNALGATSPHNQAATKYKSIANDIGVPININCSYELDVGEITLLKSSIDSISFNILRSRLAQGFGNPAAFVQFLSSPAGQNQLNTIKTIVSENLKRIIDTNICNLHLIIDPGMQNIRGVDEFAQIFVTHLDQSLSPNQTKFSYFPADRAMQLGETGIQVGSQDAAQQLVSYNEQAQTKYNRLKSLIVNTLIMGSGNDTDLKNAFKTISNIMRHKEIDTVSINDIGLLSINMKDQNGILFDIDGLSSGEKGLALTFLTIAKTIAKGGVVLLDEPELHLNPSVCSLLIDFIQSNYCSKSEIQFVMCSHSPEILAGAFSDERCSLFHIMSDHEITKVRQSDQEVVEAALRDLGTSEIDTLLYKGVLFVEGIHDKELLETGFDQMLRRYKIVDLGGRPAVESSIIRLQTLENCGKGDAGKRYFLFDNDGRETKLCDTMTVKIRQLKRRCIENYLLDVEIIASMLMDKDVCSEPLKNYGAVERLVDSIREQQLMENVAETVAYRYNIQENALPRDVFQGLLFSDVGLKIQEKLEFVSNKIGELNISEINVRYEEECNALKALLILNWKEDWIIKCDGKRAIDLIFEKARLKISKLRFKKELMRRMEANSSASWKELRLLLNSLLA